MACLGMHYLLLTAALAGVPDMDGDGHPEDVDCDDTEPAVHPGAWERPADGVDSDCDGIELCYADRDGDGFGDPNRLVEASTLDCDSSSDASSSPMDCEDRPGIGLGSFPGNDELCDGRDNDCDSLIDDDPVDVPTWYPDDDGDGAGATEGAIIACTAPEGFVEHDNDCDDSTALTHPNALESCDGADNNCDGRIDEGLTEDHTIWYSDVDGDGLGSPAEVIIACSRPPGFVRASEDIDPCPNDPDATCGVTGCRTAGAPSPWLLLSLLLLRRQGQRGGRSMSQGSAGT